MIDKPPVSSAIQKFLNAALPAHERDHTLAVAEWHDHAAHLSWMSGQMTEFATSNNVTDIGLEDSAYLNIFLWAYQDGTLQRLLGSKLAAQEYVKAAFVANTSREFPENARATATVSITAIDSGLTVTAYDTRRIFKDEFKRTNAKRKQLLQQLREEAREAGLSSTDQLKQSIRTSPGLLNHYSTEDSKFRRAWLLNEVEWLLSQNTEYARRLAAIDNFIEVGRSKTAHAALDTDALNACMLNTLSLPKGNRITLSGIKHIDGIGGTDSAGEAMHGTFGHHLFAMGNSHQPHNVTQAIIATTGMLADYAREPHVYALPMPTINVESGTVSDAGNGHITGEDNAKILAKTNANPLLMPDIKAAAEALRVAMNGADKARVR